MLSKVSPTISNGNRNLVLNETFGFDPSQLLEISVPAAKDASGNSISLIFQFVFTEGAPEDVTGARFEISGTIIVFTLTNFLKSLPAGTTAPFQFKYAEISFFAYFSISTLTNKNPDLGKVSFMNFTVYKEGV